MRNFILVCLLVLSMACFGCSMVLGGKSKLVAVQIEETGSAGYYENISPRMVKEMMDSGEDFVLVDVRTSKEYKSGHLKGAKHLPLGEIDAWYNKLDRNEKTVVYCLGGVRSVEASEKLVEKGLKSVYNMEGGISDWKYETFK